MTGHQLEELVVPEVEALGFECVLLELAGNSRNPVLRLYIDKPDGVTVGDCSLVSRTVGLALEQADPFAGRYLLEVSSPGSNRPLVKPEHYERYVGSTAKVQTRDESGVKATYTGTIKSCVDGVLTMTVGADEVHVALADVTRAQLTGQEYKIDKKKKKEKRERRNRRKGDRQ